MNLASSRQCAASATAWLPECWRSRLPGTAFWDRGQSPASLDLISPNLRKDYVIMKHSRLAFIGLVISAALMFGTCGAVLAHGQTQVGDYGLEIGFHNEPVFQGDPNSLDLFVTNTKTNKPVNGLEATLQAEIIFGSSKKQLTLSPQDEVEGGYTAAVIPTEVGDYTWHVWGTIEGTPVDVSMTSSPETFGSVEPKAGYAFPGAEPALADMQAQAASASSLALMALAVGIAGLLLGAGGLAVGLMRKPAPRP